MLIYEQFFKYWEAVQGIALYFEPIYLSIYLIALPFISTTAY